MAGTRERMVFPESLNVVLSDQIPLDVDIPSVVRIRAFLPTDAVGNPNKIDVEPQQEIYLPVPIALSNNYGIEFDTNELGAIGQIISGVLSTFSGNAAGAGSGLLGGALSAANALTLLDIPKRELGFSLNKYNELAISKPTMRTFNLSFDFAPKNPRESQMAKKIIHSLKVGMYPTTEEFTGGGVTELQEGQGSLGGEDLGLFKPVYRNPLKYIVDFLFQNQETNSLYRTAPCFITNLNVNYHRAGAPSYLPDGEPTMSSIDITLGEIFPLTRTAITQIEGISPTLTPDSVGQLADAPLIKETLDTAAGIVEGIESGFGSLQDAFTLPSGQIVGPPPR